MVFEIGLAQAAASAAVARGHLVSDVARRRRVSALQTPSNGMGLVLL